MTRRFSCASARSGALTWGLSLVILVETSVVHLWMVHRFPLAIWALTLMGLGTVAWLVADYRGLGEGGVSLDEDSVSFAIGRRFRDTLPRSAITEVARASWRDIPAPGTPGFLNATKPAEPNVLFRLSPGTAVKVLGTTRPVSVIGVHMDQPDELVASFDQLKVLGSRLLV